MTNKCPYCGRWTLNKNQNKIIDIIKNSKKSMSIANIHKKMDISYKSVYKNIQILKEANIVKLTKNPNASGQAVTVEHTLLRNNPFYEDVFGEEKDEKNI